MHFCGYPAEVSALYEFVQRERACCPFFEFDVTEDRAELCLTITGPPEASPLLDLLYQLAQPTAQSQTT